MKTPTRDTDYDLFEHRHRFAVWAAARAAQRGFASVALLREALEATDLVDFLLGPGSLETGAATFDALHRRWCSAIVDFLHERGIDGPAYGRAAKLVAVYLKAMIVTGPHPDSRLASVAHPPIDRILLKNVSAATRSPRWRTLAWTQLDERSYYELIAEFRVLLPEQEPFWKLERYWTVV